MLDIAKVFHEGVLRYKGEPLACMRRWRTNSISKGTSAGAGGIVLSSRRAAGVAKGGALRSNEVGRAFILS